MRSASPRPYPHEWEGALSPCPFRVDVRQKDHSLFHVTFDDQRLGATWALLDGAGIVV
jgi:hypothetical protein